ncbi:MAG TPA: hypothetical protein VH143_01960 [Kofleriaceae bacterium]|jgi:hypothetical protein|nr:hypothetical protein [Kofleriaceae bacterium]
MSKTNLSTFATALALVVGCGGVPKPEARISSDEGAIRGAQEAGANAVPEAALHVKLAQEERQQAMSQIEHGDNHRAAMLLARSEADAELALALARQAAATSDADKAREADESLKTKPE